MPRKNPVPQNERTICDRLRSFRTLVLEKSQTAVARKLGIDSTRLAAYEHARVPLRFGLVQKYVQAFRVSLIWLAEGKGDPSDFVELPSDIADRIPPESLFSHAYETTLKPLWIANQRFSWFAVAAILGEGPPIQLDEPGFYLQGLIDRIILQFDQCPPNLQGELVTQLLRSLSGFQRQFVNQLESYEVRSSAKKVLPNVTDYGNTSEVKSHIARLRDRLNKATAARGMKAELARAMGVHLVNVSQWLSGEREPAGETTLRLLNWVELQERKTTK
jgi:transcriptional regulator with XRE-family HTH domain